MLRSYNPDGTNGKWRIDNEMLHYTAHMTNCVGNEDSEARAKWAALPADGDFLEQFFATKAPWESPALDDHAEVDVCGE